MTGHAGRIEAGIWNRPYVLCLAANFLIFYVVTSFVLYPLLIKDSGGTDTQVGLIMGVFSVVAVLLRPVTGMAAERLSYRAVALFGLATMAALVPFFSLVEPVGWPVVMLRALFGVGWSCILAPLMALATRLTPANHLSEALGIFGISGLLAHALSPMISELVVARSGFQTLFILDCLLAVMAMGLVAAVPSGRNMPDAPPGSTPPRASGRLLMAAIAGVVLVAIAHGAVRGTNLNFIGPYCRSIGIELRNGGCLTPAGDGARFRTVTGRLSRPRNQVLAAGGHWWESFAEAQMGALARLCREISTRYHISPDHMVGHDQVATPPGRKIDPGPLFHWDRLRRESAPKG